MPRLNQDTFTSLEKCDLPIFRFDNFGANSGIILTISESGQFAIEVRLSDSNVAKNFTPFLSELKNTEKIQLVKNIEKEKMYPSGVEIRKASKWLCTW